MTSVVATIKTATTVLETIDTVINKWKKVKTTLTTEDIKRDKILVKSELAVSFKGLTKPDVKAMDGKLKIIITEVTDAIGKLTDASWSTLMTSMNKNALVCMKQGSEINNSRFFNIRDLDPADVSTTKEWQEVNTWFKKVISDSDVLADIDIDINTIATTARVLINNYEKRHQNDDIQRYTRREFVDIGVLRYPNPRMPYFTIYHIKLGMWSEMHNIPSGSDRHGIFGVYKCLKYEPCDSAIKDLKEDTKIYAIKRAEMLFTEKSDAN